MRPFIRISWLLNIVILLDLVILTVEMNSSLDKLSNAQALPFIIFKMMNVAWLCFDQSVEYLYSLKEYG